MTRHWHDVSLELVLLSVKCVWSSREITVISIDVFTASAQWSYYSSSGE